MSGSILQVDNTPPKNKNNHSQRGRVTHKPPVIETWRNSQLKRERERETDEVKRTLTAPRQKKHDNCRQEQNQHAKVT